MYGGSQITNLEITLDKLANRVSIANKEIKILVYYIPKSAKIIFSHSNNLYEKIKDTDENIGLILSEYLIENSFDRNQVIFKYNNNIVYPDQTLSQFINRHAINFDNEKEKNSDIEIEIKIEVIDIHEINKIISFCHSNEKYEDYYSIEKKMNDIFIDYTKKNKINYKKVEFKYKDNKIKKDQTLKDFINKDKKEFNQNQTLESIDIIY